MSNKHWMTTDRIRNQCQTKESNLFRTGQDHLQYNPRKMSGVCCEDQSTMWSPAAKENCLASEEWTSNAQYGLCRDYKAVHLQYWKEAKRSWQRIWSMTLATYNIPNTTVTSSTEALHLGSEHWRTGRRKCRTITGIGYITQVIDHVLGIWSPG